MVNVNKFDQVSKLQRMTDNLREYLEATGLRQRHPYLTSCLDKVIPRLARDRDQLYNNILEHTGSMPSFNGRAQPNSPSSIRNERRRKRRKASSSGATGAGGANNRFVNRNGRSYRGMNALIKRTAQQYADVREARNAAARRLSREIRNREDEFNEVARGPARSRGNLRGRRDSRSPSRRRSRGNAFSTPDGSPTRNRRR